MQIGDRILVTGGAGFIGSTFIKWCLDNGIPAKDISVIDSFSTGSLSNIDSRIPDTNLFYFDLANAEHFLYRKIKWGSFDYVFHFAALARVQKSYAAPQAYFSNNVNSTLNLLDALRKNGKQACTIYNFSSSTVVTDLNSPYAHSKKMAEEICLYYKKHHSMNIVTFRLSSVYGMKMDISNDNSLFLGKMIRCIATGQPFFVNNNGQSIRAFTNVYGLCKFLFQNNGMNLTEDIYNLFEKQSKQIIHSILDLVKECDIDLDVTYLPVDNVAEAKNNYHHLPNENYIELDHHIELNDWLKINVFYQLDYWKNLIQK